MTPKKWTLLTLLHWTEGYLKKKEIPSARLDAELLIAHSFQLERVQIYTQYDRPVSQEELRTFKKNLQRRASREPLAYIVGHKEFYSLKFRAHEKVLIPRPETEQLVDLSLEFLKQLENPSPRILDIGVGSGCVLISILKNFPSTIGIGIDKSRAAIACAQENAAFHGVLDRIRWIERDFSNLPASQWQEPFDIVCANLPYIPFEDIDSLMPEVSKFEPKEALVADHKGLFYIHLGIEKLRPWLSDKGVAFLEIGEDQGKDCLEKSQKLGFVAQIHRDLSGKDRVLEIKKPPEVSPTSSK